MLEKLLDWASASIESSLNQPALPHVIIALNATELTIDDKQWDIEEATRILMSDIEGAIARVPRFAEYARIWNQRGRPIKTTKDLLECYYSSVTVIEYRPMGDTCSSMIRLENCTTRSRGAASFHTGRKNEFE